MIAIKRLQSIMWILVVAMGALSAYLISLRVATERNAVHDVIDQIRWTRANIRYLEAEFGSRASMRQLAAWNQNDLRLYVPSPTQYLPDERALANLDRIAPAGEGYAPPPVMTAMATKVAQHPVEVAQAEAPAPPAAALAPKKATTEAPARSTGSDFSLIKTASAAELKVRDDSKAKTRAEDKFIRPAGEPDPDARKKARLALLDEKLLGAAPLARLDRVTRAPGASNVKGR
ncbi:colicin transporter [Sphingobium nicotianae]|uniref:Colicin transporter n=1 Tax=Sphingobium nicotianae TaxID=2782607 RepID=A0A9X1DD76_9SPHN|nr:colicin transporter [Sphingobium nicotianae]MBT2188012.1 colicin transporter [Sphingobium nicotianae]